MNQKWNKDINMIFCWLRKTAKPAAESQNKAWGKKGNGIAFHINPGCLINYFWFTFYVIFKKSVKGSYNFVHPLYDCKDQKVQSYSFGYSFVYKIRIVQ